MSPDSFDFASFVSVIQQGEITKCDLLPWGSNYTFLVNILDGNHSLRAVYKPRRGEAPLWDFPHGTLYRRELAAYLVSQAIGWQFIPPTVIRQGPHGMGSVQLYIDAVADQDYFTFRGERVHDLMRIAAFDYFTNNADRKAGHCVVDKEGKIWGIDHGLTFNVAYKLRTVIWDFAGQPFPEDIALDIKGLQLKLEPEASPVGRLSDLLSGEEIDALRQRVGALVESGAFPRQGPGRNVPWPMY